MVFTVIQQSRKVDHRSCYTHGFCQLLYVHIGCSHFMLMSITTLQFCNYTAVVSSHLQDKMICVISRICFCFSKLFTTFHFLFWPFFNLQFPLLLRQLGSRSQQARLMHVREYVTKAFLSLCYLFLLLPLLVLQRDQRVNINSGLDSGRRVLPSSSLSFSIFPVLSLRMKDNNCSCNSQPHFMPLMLFFTFV